MADDRLREPTLREAFEFAFDGYDANLYNEHEMLSMLAYAAKGIFDISKVSSHAITQMLQVSLSARRRQSGR